MLGCSHRGVINTLNHVTRLTGKHRIHAILGGLHLGKASEAKLKKIISCLHTYGLEKIGVGHCTGARAFLALANEFGDRVFLNTVGIGWNFEAPKGIQLNLPSSTAVSIFLVLWPIQPV